MKPADSCDSRPIATPKTPDHSDPPRLGGAAGFAVARYHRKLHSIPTHRTTRASSRRPGHRTVCRGRHRRRRTFPVSAPADEGRTPWRSHSVVAGRHSNDERHTVNVTALGTLAVRSPPLGSPTAYDGAADSQRFAVVSARWPPSHFVLSGRHANDPRSRADVTRNAAEVQRLDG
jgi:hypothetical protein